MLFPNKEGHELEAVAINTAGGVTGGDQFALRAVANSGTRLVLTTQAAERAYRAQPDEIGRIENRLVIKSNARVDWMPQETILFNQCSIQRSLKVDMEENARLLMVEPLVFGRTACGERLTQADFRDRIEIRKNGRAHFLDAVHLTGDIDSQLSKAAVVNGASAMAVLLYIAPDAEAYLGHVRSLLPDTAGASLIHDDTLVVRALAEDSFSLRRFLIPILNRLSGNSLPRPWMI